MQIIELFPNNLHFMLSLDYTPRRQWHPTPVLLPGKSHGWRSMEDCSPWGCWGSDMTEQLHFHFSLSCIGEGNGNPLQCSCLENPRGGGAWWAAVHWVAQSRTRLKRLSSWSSSIEHLLDSGYNPNITVKPAPWDLGFSYIFSHISVMPSTLCLHRPYALVKLSRLQVLLYFRVCEHAISFSSSTFSTNTFMSASSHTGTFRLNIFSSVKS